MQTQPLSYLWSPDQMHRVRLNALLCYLIQLTATFVLVAPIISSIKPIDKVGLASFCLVGIYIFFLGLYSLWYIKTRRAKRRREMRRLAAGNLANSKHHSLTGSNVQQTRVSKSPAGASAPGESQVPETSAKIQKRRRKSLFASKQKPHGRSQENTVNGEQQVEKGPSWYAWSRISGMISQIPSFI